MVVRFQTSKRQWRRLKPFFPGKEEDPGRTAYDNRLDFEALLYMAREGCPWRALPAEFGDWRTVHQRFSRWWDQGVFGLLTETFIARYGVDTLMVDGTIVPVHQDATGARKKWGSPEDQAIGISRGGRTTKILAAGDENGNAIAFALLPGNAGESPHVQELVDEIKAKTFIGDKAYDSDKLIDWFVSRGTEVVVPPRKNRKIVRSYDEEKYKSRHLIENIFQRVKRFRRIATRYDKLARIFAAFLILVIVYLVTRDENSILRNVRVARRITELADVEVYVPEGEQRAAQPIKRRHDPGWFG